MPSQRTSRSQPWCDTRRPFATWAIYEERDSVGNCPGMVASTSATLVCFGDVPSDVPKGLSQGLAYLVEQEAASEHSEEAFALITRRLQLCRNLHTSSPDNAQTRTELINALRATSRGFTTAGGADVGLAAAAEAVAVAEEAVADQPAVFEHRRNLAWARRCQAEVISPEAEGAAMPPAMVPEPPRVPPETVTAELASDPFTESQLPETLKAPMEVRAAARGASVSAAGAPHLPPTLHTGYPLLSHEHCHRNRGGVTILRLSPTPQPHTALHHAI